MTDKELEELEEMDPEERARLLSHKDTFALSCRHLDIIVNDLFRDDDAKLARLIRDLVAFNVDGTNDLLDNIDDQDNADRTARKLLYDDCKVFIDKWLLTSWHNALNRRGKTKASNEQDQEQSTGDTGRYYPTLEEVKQEVVNCLGGVPDEVRNEIAEKWYQSETKQHWRDDRGKPLEHWRKVCDTYCNKVYMSIVTEKAVGK